MFAVEVYAAVRQFVFIDGHSRREAARVFGLNRETISKMCRFSLPPAYLVLGLNTTYQVTPNLQVLGLITNLTNNRYANFGTFRQPGLIANLYTTNDPRTTSLAQPLSIYGGIRYAFGADPVPMPEPIMRKY